MPVTTRWEFALHTVHTFFTGLATGENMTCQAVRGCSDLFWKLGSSAMFITYARDKYLSKYVCGNARCSRCEYTQGSK